jgi:hypothetical protein
VFVGITAVENVPELAGETATLTALWTSRMSSILWTASVLLAEFWYDALLPRSCARDASFQLFSFITGYPAMKDATDWSDNSCSSIMRPGLFEPVSHWVIDELMSAAVVPPEVRLQSAVLNKQTVNKRYNHNGVGLITLDSR